MPDTDLQIRGGGGGGVIKNLFSALRASVWSKNKGGGALLDPPLRTTAEHFVHLIIT